MEKELSKSLFCVSMRNGVEIWMEQDRIKKLQSILESISGTKFINFDDQTINTADLVGVFAAGTMEDHTRRKNGNWKCAYNFWHDRGIKCECRISEKKNCISCGALDPSAKVSIEGGIKCLSCWSR